MLKALRETKFNAACAQLIKRLWLGILLSYLKGMISNEPVMQILRNVTKLLIIKEARKLLITTNLKFDKGLFKHSWTLWENIKQWKIQIPSVVITSMLKCQNFSWRVCCTQTMKKSNAWIFWNRAEFKFFDWFIFSWVAMVTQHSLKQHYKYSSLSCNLPILSSSAAAVWTWKQNKGGYSKDWKTVLATLMPITCLFDLIDNKCKGMMAYLHLWQFQCSLFDWWELYEEIHSVNPEKKIWTEWS